MRVLIFALATSLLFGQTNLAPTPPMGWNSWDSYGTTVREQDVKANADVMARDLKKYGWQYVVVDIQWYEPHAQGHEYKKGAPLQMDEYGRLTPAANRFPSAAGGAGFKPLADYVHGLGLKFGIHIMRGIPRQAADKNTPILHSKYKASDVADRNSLCDWNPDMYGVDMTKPGAQEYYNSLAELYASWGVDFVKADDMSRPYEKRRPEVVALSKALHGSGRPILLSLSPGAAPLNAAGDLSRQAQMWRISDDFWDKWELLRKQFDYTRDWAPYIGNNGTWPDADMLPFGMLRVNDKKRGPEPSKFTADEQRTVMTLWSIFRSPLIFGGDLPRNDAQTKALIMNEEVLQVNQHSRNNRQSYDKDDIRAWTADAEAGGAKYVAVFNLQDKPANVVLKWPQLGVSLKECTARDLWLHHDLVRASGPAATIPAHGAVLYKLTP